MNRFARVQRRMQDVLKRRLGLYVSRKPPFGSDPLAEVRRLRTWVPGDVIFDVGANDGRSVLKLRQYFPAPTIYSFEPVPETFRRLTLRVASMKDVHTFELALGAKPGASSIYIDKESVLSSFSPMGWEPHSTLQVGVSTIDEMVAELRLDYVHFLKVDTEGSDLDVLLGAEATLVANRIGIIQVEAGFHQHSRSLAGLEEIRRYLGARSYSLFGLFNQSRTRKGPRAVARALDSSRPEIPKVLAYCDAVFVSDALLVRNFG